MPPPQTPCFQKTTWLVALLQGQEINPIPRDIPSSLLVWPVKNAGAKAWLIASLPAISLPDKEPFPKFSLCGMNCWQRGLNFMTHWAFWSPAAQDTPLLRPIQKATEQCLRQETALSMNDCQKTQGVFRKGYVLSQHHCRKNMNTGMQRGLWIEANSEKEDSIW